jgi:hypothetical protein
MSTATVTAEAAAVADGLEALAAKVRTGELHTQPWGVEILYNPGGRDQVRAEAERLSLRVHEGPGYCRATMPLSPRVAYVLYAQSGTEAVL